MTAAYELHRAGYTVRVLEYNDRPGGRNWSLCGGDRYTELGGAMQECGFDPGLYFNPGRWRIPYHHRHLLGYCTRFGVALEPLIQVNYNSYLHSLTAFGGRPQRYRHIDADYRGDHVTLSDVQIAAVIDFVRSPFGNHYCDRITAAEVKAVREHTSGLLA